MPIFTTLSLVKRTRTLVTQGALSGGGFFMSLSFSNNGQTFLATYDSGASYIYNSAAQEWDVALSQTSMPNAKWWESPAHAVWLQVAPNDSNRVYAISNNTWQVWRSSDRCQSFIDTGKVITGGVENFGSLPSLGRCPGPQICIDPKNSDVVYVFADNGKLYRTLDGFATMAQVMEAPQFTSTSGGSIAIDHSASTTALSSVTVSSVLYIGFGSGGDAVYQSTDGGATFNSIGGLSAIEMMKCSGDGVLYVVEKNFAKANNCWRYVNVPPAGSGLAATTWTNFASPVAGSASSNVFHSVACDVNGLVPGRVAFMMMAGNLQLSSDWGKTWWASVYPLGFHRTGSNPAWHDTTGETWMSNGDCCFDPVVPGRLWFCEGIGVWFCDPNPASSTGLICSSRSNRLGGLITQAILKPPSSSAVYVTVQDRIAVRLPDANTEPVNDYSALYGTGGIAHGGGIAYALDGSGALFMAMANLNIQRSMDDGATWTRLTNTLAGAGLAAQSANNFVSIGNFTAQYTADGGATAPSCLFNGAPQSDGWGGLAYYDNLAADFVDTDTYYCYAGGNLALYSIDSIISGGSGYKVGDILGVSGQTNSGGTPNVSSRMQVTSVDGNGAITGIIVTNAGSGWGQPASNPVNPFNGKCTLGTVTGTTLTINGTITDNFGVGYTVSGSGIPANTTILSRLSGLSNTAGSTFQLSQSASIPTGQVIYAIPNGVTGTGAQFNGTFGTMGSRVWKSTDGGANWTQGGSMAIGAQGPGVGNMKLVAVPGYAGHLIATWPAKGFPNFPAMRSIDGGATWKAIPGTGQIWIGTWGKAKPGAVYPAIYVAGYIDVPRATNPGIFRAIDVSPTDLNAVPTWERLCDAPGGNLMGPRSFCGDPDVYGSFYLGFTTVGYAYGRLA